MHRVRLWTAVGLVATTAALGWPAASAAATVTLGRPNLSTAAVGSGLDCQGPGCQSVGAMNTALSTPGALLTAPADGTLTAWRARGLLSGTGRMQLHVVRPGGDGSFTGIATSPNAVAVDGNTPNQTSLAVGVGDTLSVFIQNTNPAMASDHARVDASSAPGGTWAYAAIYADGVNKTPSSPTPNQELLYNATVDLFRRA